MLITLLLSQGVPMLRAGDELLQTQQGNNNVYCQDNELSWIDWTPNFEARQQTQFLSQIARLRKSLVERNFFIRYIWDLSSAPASVHWIRRDGQLMSEQDWHDGKAQVGVLLSRSRAAKEPDAVSTDRDDVVIVFNAHHEPFVMQFPETPDRCYWRMLIDTFHPQQRPINLRDGQFVVEPRSSAVFAVTRGFGWG